MYVASNHKLVVTATTNGNSAQPGIKPSIPNKEILTDGIVRIKEIKPDTTMAVISLQALILHQNHRKIKISPVPAPKTRSKLNNCIAF